MKRIPDDFLYFLQKNFPTAFNRANAEDVSESTINSLISTYGHRFEIYKQIPDWIKNKYGDKIPQEVLNGTVPVWDYVEKEREKYKTEQKETENLIGFSVSMLALGYTAETVTTLAKDRAERERLLAEAGEMGLTPEQFAKWLATRERDIKAITKDWQDNQPEKYLLHVAKSISRAKKQMAKDTTNEEDKALLAKKIKKLEQELKKLSSGLDNRGVKQNIVDYLRAQPQQAALRHLEPETLSLLTGLMAKQGIKIEAVKGSKMNSLTSAYESLTASLKRDFAEMEKSGSLLRRAVQSGKNSAERIATRVAQKASKKKTKKLAQARRLAQKQNSAG